MQLGKTHFLRIVHILAAGFLAVLFTSSGCNQDKAAVLTIAAASNMQFVMPKLIDAFKEETGHDALAVFSSSGKLTAQIIAGAPFDLFISADLKYPQKIIESGSIKTASQAFALGKLVLIVSKEVNFLEINDLQNEAIEHIAIANSVHAPFGKAAEQWLVSNTDFAALEHKMVYGDNVMQAVQFVQSGVAQAAIVAGSVSVELSGEQYELKDISGSATDSILKHASLVVSDDVNKAQLASAFQQFLAGDRALEILVSSGYRPL